MEITKVSRELFDKLTETAGANEEEVKVVIPQEQEEIKLSNSEWEELIALNNPPQINGKNYKQLNYNLMSADLTYGEHRHPQVVMRGLGLKILDAVPQSMFDCWWVTVEEFNIELPPYITEMTYNLNYWKYDCWRACEYFKKNSSVCFGGEYCPKYIKQEK